MNFQTPTQVQNKVSTRNHKWNDDDSILTIYYTKFGLKNLPVENEKELAEWIIGSTKTSLSMQSMNIRHLMGYDDGILTDYSESQGKMYEKYSGHSEEDLRKVVDEIINKRDLKQNILVAKSKKLESKRKVWKEESDKALEMALRRTGRKLKKL